VDWAVKKAIIDPSEKPLLLEALTALYDVIRVDAFDASALKAKSESVQGKHRVVERA
jgi:acyl-CoA dehydrogenase